MNLENKNSYIQTFLIVALGLTSFGGGLGRFSYGLAPFDFLLIFSFLFLFRQKIEYSKYLYFYVFLVFYGIFVSAFNSFNQHSFFITELRFYLYIPVLYLISINFNFNVLFLRKIIYITLFYYIVIYIQLVPGTLIYEYFNSSDIALQFNQLERFIGPVPIISVVLMLLYFKFEKKYDYFLITFYILVIFLIFIKTGGRTVLIINLLPFIYLIKSAKYSFFILFLLYFIIQILPQYASLNLLERIYNMKDPLSDDSINYRIINNYIMFNDIISDRVAPYFGFGIGSTYNVHISQFFSSFYVDNSFITMSYKFGFILTAIFYVITFSIGSWSDIKWKIITLLFIVLPGLLSYHVILNPIYLFSYFLMSKKYAIE